MSVFADGNNDDNGNAGANKIENHALWGETGTPPYDPSSYGRHEDNRHIEETGWYDPYAAYRDAYGQLPRPYPDVDVTYLDVPDPSVPHETTETKVIATITNWDMEPHLARIYLQVYEEVKFEPFIIWEDDMESCCVNWTAVDGDGDGVTWGQTEVRSYSPTTSWHNVYDCTEGTYVGNSNDSLISREIEIPDVCDGDKPALLWFNFMQWMQGEVSDDSGKFEDYGNVYYRIDGGEWILVGSYADTGGEWLTGDPNDDDITAIQWSGGVFDYTPDGEPLGWRIPITADNSTVQFRFQFRSDPCHQYEGWYIDDFVLYAQCGGLQELVHQQYKPVDHPLELAAFNNSGFQVQVQFYTDFVPKDDTTYFFEVYSELIDTEDVDGHFDYVGDNAMTTRDIAKLGIPDDPEGWFIDPMTGARYWNPANGVN
ncbi:MAG: hypothetical protein ACP5FL_06650, partial [Thermoplasmatota archaeon]